MFRHLEVVAKSIPARILTVVVLTVLMSAMELGSIPAEQVEASPAMASFGRPDEVSPRAWQRVMDHIAEDLNASSQEVQRVDDAAGHNTDYEEEFVSASFSASTMVKQTASDAQVGDNFGFSVSISGDTIVVGADLEASRQCTQGNRRKRAFVVGFAVPLRSRCYAAAHAILCKARVRWWHYHLG